ncbi:MAG: HAD-IA family hydrolase [Lachnospiraceae bacterium]|nr:HAD-IA family hydrolase [Lachnospiraceae bacterium]
MNDKYQMEIDEFAERFGKHRSDRIILYGIGRYTATLLEGLKGFRIVGLMDKDPANVGKEIFGLPVVDRDTAESCADMIVINTAETYWDVIYDRIRDIRIPVYYKNGEAAHKAEAVRRENPFRDLSYDALCAQIEAAEVVSFDFFDTLFQRCVCNPTDVFSLLGKKLEERQEAEWKMERQGTGRKSEQQEAAGTMASAGSTCLSGYMELRSKAKKEIRKNYSLDELYQQMEHMTGAPRAVIEHAKSREMELEKRILVPREPMLSGLKRALRSGKEVYIVSDMYLPESFYREVMGQYDISIPAGHILLSNVLDSSKSDGTMWRYYAENIVKGRKALHIGDDHKADMEEAAKYGLETYLAPNAWSLLSVSSLRDMASHIRNNYDTVIMGCILKELLQNPYIFAHTEGKVEIRDNDEMGYCVFGPVILTFLLWLLEKSREDGVEKLVFMARDGYFLTEDFEYLCRRMGERRECCYLGISRQLAMTASIESWQDLMEYVSMPYTGSVTELFEDRLGIRDVREMADKPLEDYVREYLPEIEAYIAGIRKNYLSYVGKMGLDDGCAVVDLGYYGNNQRYLNRLIKGQMPGYYFNANLSEKNGNAGSQRMQACFQNKDDSTGEKSRILKKQIYLESFLTAPYGMVKAVDADGNFVCGEEKKNQQYFQAKIEMNRGVKQFIEDYIELFGGFGLKPDTEFVDRYYGCCFGGGMEFADEVKRSFYNDNAMMNRVESAVFY